MRLADFLNKNNISLTSFAEKLRESQRLKGQAISVETVRRYCLEADDDDFRMPRRLHMLAIVDVTRGAVLPNDFYEIDASARCDRSGAGNSAGAAGGFRQGRARASLASRVAAAKRGAATRSRRRSLA